MLVMGCDGCLEFRVDPMTAAEAALTEVPDFLLQRSKARRALLAGDAAGAAAAGAAASAGGEVEASTSAAAAETANAAPVVATPVKVAPVPPWVQESQRRPKIPIWASSVLAILPLWALVYALTLDPATPKTLGPVAEGTVVFSKCASCHGAAGGGNNGPAFTNGAVIRTFPKPADHVRWVILGTSGFIDKKIPTYGAENKPVEASKNMPAWGVALTPTELLSVVRYEREKFGGEKYNAEDWEKGVVDMLKSEFPDKAAAYETVIKSWKTLPAGA